MTMIQGASNAALPIEQSRFLECISGMSVKKNQEMSDISRNQGNQTYMAVEESQNVQIHTAFEIRDCAFRKDNKAIGMLKQLFT